MSEPGAAPPVPPELVHEAVRARLRQERARLSRSLERWGAEAAEHRRRVGERDPCAYRGEAAAREEIEAEARTRATERGCEALQEIEAALRRLESEPERFGRCGRCGDVIASERLELLPQTRRCRACAESDGTAEGR